MLRYFYNPALNCNIFYPPLLTVVALIFIVFVDRKKYFTDRISVIGNRLVFLGGFLNLFERLRTGCVLDYLNFFGLFRFNVYDVIVTVGVILLLVGIWKQRE